MPGHAELRRGGPDFTMAQVARVDTDVSDPTWSVTHRAEGCACAPEANHVEPRLVGSLSRRRGCACAPDPMAQTGEGVILP